MQKQSQAYVYAMTAVLFWATAASAFKISLRYLDFLQLLFYASMVSVVTLFVILLLQNKFRLLKGYSRGDYLRSAALGFLNPFFYYVILFKAYSLLPAQEAQPLNYTWPIMLVLLSIPLLKQRIGFRSISAIVVSFVGVLVISTHGDLLGFRFTNVQGVLLALSSSVIWALFWIYNIRDRRDVVTRLFLNFAFGFILIFISILLSSKIDTPSVVGVLAAAYVGVFEMGITFAIWLKALRLSKTTAQISNLIYIAPFLSLVVIRVVVGEKILFSTVAGLILIITGIIIQQYRH